MNLSPAASPGWWCLLRQCSRHVRQRHANRCMEVAPQHGGQRQRMPAVQARLRAPPQQQLPRLLPKRCSLPRRHQQRRRSQRLHCSCPASACYKHFQPARPPGDQDSSRSRRRLCGAAQWRRLPYPFRRWRQQRLQAPLGRRRGLLPWPRLRQGARRCRLCSWHALRSRCRQCCSSSWLWGSSNSKGGRCC